MSDTLNANAGGAGSLDTFIPEIWANQALEVLRSEIVLARLITKDTDVATFNTGDVLNVPVPGTFTTNSKAAGAGVTLQNPSSSSVQVELTEHEEVSFVVEDPAAAQAQIGNGVVDVHTRQAAVALAEKIETDISGLYSGFSSIVGTPGVGASRGSLTSIRQTLNTNKCPQAGRFVVVSPAGEVDLLEDSNLENYFANSQPSAVSEANIGRAFGFDVWMSQLVPSSGAGATSIAGTPEFGVLAMRALPVNRAPGVRQMAMRDPQSGLVLRLTASYDTDLLGVKVTIDALYGYAEMRDECGVAFAHAKT